MKSILICCSPFGNPVSDFYKYLGDTFIEKDFNLIYVFDGKIINNSNKDNVRYYSWPSKRPTKIKDFIFLAKIIIKYRPFLCISNFGSTNISTLASYFLGVKYRVNYVHTTQKQIRNDSLYSKTKSEFLKFRKQFIYRLNTHFLTNSNGTKLDFIQSFNIDINRIEIFPLLIKENNHIKIKESRSNRILIVGRLNKSKGHFELIKQFKNCIDKGLQIKLFIIGKGNLEPKLKLLVNNLDCDGYIKFLGNIPNNEISSYYCNSLIHVSSSISEAFGLVNIESLRSGTPIISTKTGGAKDILKEGINGEYFEHYKKDSLYYAIKKVLRDWDYYSKNALESFNSDYNLDTNISSYRDKLLKFLNNSKF